MNGCHPFTKKSQVKLVICWGMPTLLEKFPPAVAPTSWVSGTWSSGTYPQQGTLQSTSEGFFANNHQLQYHSGGEKKTQTNFPGGVNTIFKHLFIMIPVHCGPNLKVRWAILSPTWPTYSNHIRTKPCMSRITKEPSKNEQYQLQLLPENLWETGVQDKKTRALAVVCLPPGPKVGLPWLQHQNAGLKSKQFQCNWLRASGSGLMGGKNPKKRTTGVTSHTCHTRIPISISTIYIYTYISPSRRLYIYI